MGGGDGEEDWGGVRDFCWRRLLNAGNTNHQPLGFGVGKNPGFGRNLSLFRGPLDETDKSRVDDIAFVNSF